MHDADNRNLEETVGEWQMPKDFSKMTHPGIFDTNWIAQQVLQHEGQLLRQQEQKKNDKAMTTMMETTEKKTINDKNKPN